MKKKWTLKRVGVVLFLAWLLAWLLLGLWSCFANLRSDADESSALYAAGKAAWRLAVEEAQREVETQHLEAAAAQAVWDRLTLPFLRCRQAAAAAHRATTAAEQSRLDSEGIADPKLVQLEKDLLNQAKTTCLQAGVHPLPIAPAPVDGGAPAPTAHCAWPPPLTMEATMAAADGAGSLILGTLSKIWDWVWAREKPQAQADLDRAQAQEQDIDKSEAALTAEEAALRAKPGRTP